MASILIADDDPLYGEDLKTIFGFDLPHRVEIAHTGREALTLINESGKPDAIILDMMLPLDEKDTNGGLPPDDPKELKGLRVLDDLKGMKYDLGRVIVITAFYSQEAKRILRKAGIDEENILIKPASTAEIRTRVRAACAIRENR